MWKNTVCVYQIKSWLRIYTGKKTFSVLFRSIFLLLASLTKMFCSEVQVNRIFRRLFLLFLHQDISCGYSLELPPWGNSNEYQQDMFWCKNYSKLLLLLSGGMSTVYLCNVGTSQYVYNKQQRFWPDHIDLQT